MNQETSTYPKSFPIWKDLVDSEGRPSPSKFWYGSPAFALKGARPLQGSPWSLTSPLSPPLAKGLNEERERIPTGLPWKGTQGAADKKHPGPMMVRGYLNERATGGAVASSPYRGRPWRGWMSLLVLFSAPEKRTKTGSGGIPQREARLRCVKGTALKRVLGEIRR